MTPEEFAKKMREIFPENGYYDSEVAHVDADELMEEVLISLGYGDGVEIFREASKWYA